MLCANNRDFGIGQLFLQNLQKGRFDVLDVNDLLVLASPLVVSAHAAVISTTLAAHQTEISRADAAFQNAGEWMFRQIRRLIRPSREVLDVSWHFLVFRKLRLHPLPNV